MQNELISEGLTLMLAGMGTVFVFLTVLVIAMMLMSRLAMKIAPAAGADEEIAAITAAITEHRRK